ncbi:MAG: hypothetical protein E6G84_11880 [Alphaproteobacteria bacterium]|nr:MAG: hypothetical protein E6G84_11880 [Alphaproteobacteria bacterium]
MRWFSARHVMCQGRPHAMALPRLLDAERRLGLVAGRERAQLRRAAQHALDEEAVDHRVAQPGRLRVRAEEVVGNRAAEPIAPALRIETQQMLAIEDRFADP